MAGYLTTHVLDTARGMPAEGLRIELFRIKGETRSRLIELYTNSDGRTDTKILPEDQFETGTYELVFHAGDYFNFKGQQDGEHRFLDRVVIRFGINNSAEHYHVPLLLSPFGYSTYRGS